MKYNIIEIDKKDAVQITGGGWLYDLYRIVVTEKNDFIAGFNEGLEKGIF